MTTGSNVLSEYLVKLGFGTDTASFARFAHSLRDADSLVGSSFLSMGKKVLEFQLAGVGAFAAIGAAAVGIADKTAMADQEYRLLALHLYTSLPVARELKIALDALGQPLENVMCDPELARGFRQLVEDQRILTRELGPSFEAQMLKIRDVRFEFNRFGVELQYLTMNVVAKLAKAFGIDDWTKKLQDFNNWFIRRMPEISEWLATKLKPLLLDVKDVLWSAGSVTKELLIDFTNIVAILSGDNGLKTSTLDFQKLTDAILKTVHAIADAVIGIGKLEVNLAHLFAAAGDALQGDYKGALGELREMKPIGSVATYKASGAELSGAGPALATKKNIQQAIIAGAQQLGIPPEIALAVADYESGFRQFDKSGNVLVNRGKHGESHATGIYQLQPATAAFWGLNPKDVGENIKAGLLQLQWLQGQKNDWTKTFETYYGGRDKQKQKDYAAGVWEKVPSEYHITVTINAQTNASAKDIAHEAQKAIEQTMKNRVQRNLAEFAAPGWTYGAGW